MTEVKSETAETILQVEDLKIYFPVTRSFGQTITRQPKQYVKAVDGVSFSVKKGQTLAVVGESGCGKSTLGRSIVHLNKPVSGKIIYKGENITSDEAWKSNALRKDIQYIFQNPYASLNPKMTVLDTVKRPLEIFDMYDASEREDRAIELLQKTGISTAQAYRYPHEFSGGQRQRICVARALAVEPTFLIADEPTFALDVSIQCQVLDLLTSLQKEMNITMLFISHDLGVVNYISDEVLVMYLGHIVEKGNTHEIFRNPAHPYSQALIEALPRRGSSAHLARTKLKGYIPSPINPPSGCLLHPRCPFAKEICSTVKTEMKQISPSRCVACHFPVNR